MGYLAQPELVLIDNAHSEWEHWYNKGLCSKPSDMSVVSARKMELTLEPRQKCNLLFKFQSFREPVIEHKHQKEEDKLI